MKGRDHTSRSAFQSLCFLCDQVRIYPLTPRSRSSDTSASQSTEPLGAGELYYQRTRWDNYGSHAYATGIHQTVTQGMFVVFLVVNTILEPWRDDTALVVMQIERQNEYRRLDAVAYNLLSHETDRDVWCANGGRGRDYPPERAEAYRADLISILKAETRVITLIPSSCKPALDRENGNRRRKATECSYLT
jgi:hypothetical protein